MDEDNHDVRAASFSKSPLKRAAMMGQLKRTKPDLDNAVKGILDTLWDQDSAIADVRAVKCYGPTDGMTIEIATL
jgi:Holliday junction resolvase RusA-like endonuclease